jgi:sigma-B regulation protein RsbU (phosphoserine phosphatase)
VTQAVYRVVVAEDDYLVAEEIERQLRRVGHHIVATAATGREAVAAVVEHEPDAILMDIQMPELDGFEAAREIQNCRPTPVVVLTAYDDAAYLERAGEVGVQSFLTKPPDGRSLDRALAIAIARHGDMMALMRLNRLLRERTRALEVAVAEVEKLREIVPMCMHCKSIRDGRGFWLRVEEYIHKYAGLAVSHGLCDECARELYPDLADDSD